MRLASRSLANPGLELDTRNDAYFYRFCHLCVVVTRLMRVPSLVLLFLCIRHTNSFLYIFIHLLHLPFHHKLFVS